ncbi:hypothetical protein FO488_09470 [Geobacter sp. FeAm09]|uniref:hypothetical protein n=1 Tax=Geobacter sp. FeAm09 TaxID=2597769 RepID=UPI0011EF7C6E|nr:hypothetical protein [Geobacter sp. FeAm09]QEM68371.1 hypothetical protein FO488_09470 [Geobacter sp. FeAm09]
MKTFITVIACLLWVSVAAPSHARNIKTVGSGPTINFDPAMIPLEHQESYQIMGKKCTTCHGMDRIVLTILTGKAQVTKQPFDREQAAGYGIRLIRMHNTGLKKEEIRDVIRMLQWLIDEKNKH